MNTQTFYIPISRNKLAYFFSRGVIVPSKYLENSQKDIQNRFDDYIIFSKSKFTTESDCCIEVVLDKKELARVTPVSRNFSTLDRPLAISRVTAIYFRTEEERDNTIYSITRENGDAFIPKRLNNIAKDKSIIDVNELNEIKYEANPEEWSPELKRFDQLMGGFALMKLSNEEENYTPEYFQALGSINNYFSPSNEDAKFKFLFAREDDEVTDSTFDLYRRLIFSDLNSGIVVDFSQKESIQVSKNSFGDIDIEPISESTLTYILAILATYGSYGGGKTVDDFLSSFIKGEIRSRDEQELLLIFGVNKGYKIFNNNYSFPGVNINLKFKLERKVDYYVIESIYQNTFNLDSEYNPEDIIDPFHELPYEYYDPSAGELLEVKKKRSTGFFALLDLFSQKNNESSEGCSETAIGLSKAAKPVKSLFDVISLKVINLEERVSKAALYINDLKKKLNQRIDDASAKSEEALNKLELEVQNKYASKVDIANVNQTIAQKTTALDRLFTQEIERIDDASTKSEESLASLKSEIQDSYISKAEIVELKQVLESKYYSKADLDELVRQVAQEVSKPVSDLKAKLEASIEFNNKQKETINALNARFNDLEEKFQNLEQKSVQYIGSKASKGQLKNKTSDRVESETGDLFEDEAEPLNEERVKELTKLKRAELDNIAKNYGLTYNSYRTKSDIANAIAYWEASNDHDNS